MQLVTAILRGFQAIFAIVVLGISVDLARGQETRVQSVPAATGYAAFCGGLGTLVALIGVASLFVSSLDGIITWALDGLSSLTMLAAGIAFAVLLRDANCSRAYTAERNSLLNGGCFKEDGDSYCRYTSTSDSGKLKSRCVSAKADTAFMFISFVTCLAIVGYSFFMRGRGAKGVSYA
ncbi:marvel domain-containing protein [Aspergillus pseudoustus]|uniref:Marvel domain-containing protein n=1 Tax=Aspergillus pseudoustus TaxID=1810923 RepID=A0ABR4IWP2_9EURO